MKNIFIHIVKYFVVLKYLALKTQKFVFLQFHPHATSSRACDPIRWPKQRKRKVSHVSFRTQISQSFQYTVNPVCYSIAMLTCIEILGVLPFYWKIYTGMHAKPRLRPDRADSV